MNKKVCTSLLLISASALASVFAFGSLSTSSKITAAQLIVNGNDRTLTFDNNCQFVSVGENAYMHYSNHMFAFTTSSEAEEDDFIELNTDPYNFNYSYVIFGTNMFQDVGRGTQYCGFSVGCSRVSSISIDYTNKDSTSDILYIGWFCLKDDFSYDGGYLVAEINISSENSRTTLTTDAYGIFEALKWYDFDGGPQECIGIYSTSSHLCIHSVTINYTCE